ncbi:MAG: DUF547 domain-containing protein [Rubripirellula sp.]
MQSAFQSTVRIALAFISWAVFTIPLSAASPVYVGKKSSAGSSMDKIDHTPWSQLLSKYVDSDGKVNYQLWKSTAADVLALEQYLQHLSDASAAVSATRASKLSFWINAYNAVTVRGILREFPTSSIRNHTAKIWGYNIWQDLQLHVGGKPYSLEQIEHQVLRKMSEPRIHFAIVCASLGCPRLLNAAYLPATLNEQLETNSRDFFSRPQNFRHDIAGKRFYLSSILDWFATDFGNGQKAQLAKIAKWLPTQSASDAAKKGAITVSHLGYDWSLNDQ